jgi:phage gp46-like protein
MILGEPLLTFPLLGDSATMPPPVVIPVYPNVIPTYPTDVAQYWNQTNGYSDFQIINNGLGTNRDLLSAIIVSLFSDRLANASDALPDPRSTNRCGWWADSYSAGNVLIGSRLWLLSRSKSSPALLLTAQGYCEEALQWLIDDKVVGAITVRTWFCENNQELLGIAITVYQQGQTPVTISFQYVWTQISTLS